MLVENQDTFCCLWELESPRSVSGGKNLCIKPAGYKMETPKVVGTVFGKTSVIV